jgi:hypothetical protein
MIKKIIDDSSWQQYFGMVHDFNGIDVRQLFLLII